MTSLYDEVQAYLDRARAAGNDEVEGFCSEQLGGHNAYWRYVETVTWGERADGTPLPCRRDPRALTEMEFRQLSEEMYKGRLSARWSLYELEKMISESERDEREVLAWDQNPNIFFLRSDLLKLCDTIRARLRNLLAQHPLPPPSPKEKKFRRYLFINGLQQGEGFDVEGVLYACETCGTRGVKLWRPYNSSAVDLRCGRCACEEEKIPYAVDAMGTMPDRLDQRPCDQIGWYVPAVPDEFPDADGVVPGVFKGYTSISVAGVQWWQSLPTEKAPRWRKI